MIIFSIHRSRNVNIRSFRRAFLLSSMILLFIAFSSGNGNAQVNDAGLWLSVNIEKKITPLLSAYFTEELRMNENITEAGTIFSEFGLSYRLSKRFKVGATYRHSHKRNLDDSYDTRQRWYFDFTYRERVSVLTLLLRMRFQTEYTDFYTSAEGKVPEYHIVPKLTIKADLNRNYVPYIYAEPYYRVNDPVYGPCDKLRLCAGVEYTINRMHMLDLHYLIQKEYNVKNPETDFVVGLSYYFTF